jgi:hypothetical protein
VGQVETRDPGVDYAIGSGLMLLAAVLSGALMAFLLSSMVGRTYVTFLMPFLAGWAIGAVVGLVARGFHVRSAAPVVATALLGAFVAYGAFHLIVYTDVLDQAARTVAVGLDGSAPEEGASAAFVQQQFEIATARDGFWAYLDYTATTNDGVMSPLGILAKGGIEYSTALFFLVGEAVICMGASVGMALFRARQPKKARKSVEGAA